MERLVLPNGKIFDSINGVLQEGNTIVISNNKIAWIGNNDQFEKEENDKIIDVSEKILLPGLIDCHTHIGYNPTAQMDREFMRTSTPMYAYVALANSQKHLIGGFTTIRDCGGGKWGASLRKALHEGLLPGSRILVSQIGIGQWGNQEFVGPDELKDSGKEYEVISGKDGMMHAVRDRFRNGSDFIKTATTGGVLHGQQSKVERSLWTDDELEAMVAEAHRLGIQVASHAHGDPGIYYATKAGIDTIEHGTFITEDTAKLMIKNGTYLIPTQRAGSGLKQPEIQKQMPPEVVEKSNAVWKGMVDNHKMAFEKGVKIAVGTDAGTPANPHGATSKEITFMVENVGMSTTQALQAATIEAAKAIWREEVLGSIEIGKFGDIIVINGNPLDNIKILEDQKNLDYVIKDGKIMVKNGILQAI